LKALVLQETSDVATHPLKYEDVEEPKPQGDQILVRVKNCGVCRTDLHVVEGDIPPLVPHIIPGHEIVGEVVQVGDKVRRFKEGELVGIPWLHRTCRKCEYCITGRENLCDSKVYTGYSVNGGYAEYAIGEEGFVFRLPTQVETSKIAPLLCAGIIGYRALKLALPRAGGRIGFLGFGGSAHLTLQLATKLGYETVAFSRNRSHLKLAEELGATETVLTKNNDANHQELIPRTLDSAVVFAPAGEVVIQALRALKKGGIVSIAAIHMSPIPEMEYDNLLFGERKIISVESNTRADAQEFLDLATRLKLESTVSTRPLKDANEALIDLKRGVVTGALVLDCDTKA
jgi:alcohol dehydrogenase, propanol-preferring